MADTEIEVWNGSRHLYLDDPAEESPVARSDAAVAMAWLKIFEHIDRLFDQIRESDSWTALGPYYIGPANACLAPSSQDRSGVGLQTVLS